eukprot:scaffold3443_cov404-Prasinococcus_capsulatus_cf.AAC.3
MAALSHHSLHSRAPTWSVSPATQRTGLLKALLLAPMVCPCTETGCPQRDSQCGSIYSNSRFRSGRPIRCVAGDHAATCLGRRQSYELCMSSAPLPVKVPTRSTPDFTLVYSYISTLFDTSIMDEDLIARQRHASLEDMEPIDRETILLLLKNLTANLQSPTVWRDHISFLQKDANIERDPNSSDGLHEPGTTTPSNGQIAGPNGSGASRGSGSADGPQQQGQNVGGGAGPKTRTEVPLPLDDITLPSSLEEGVGVGGAMSLGLDLFTSELGGLGAHWVACNAVVFGFLPVFERSVVFADERDPLANERHNGNPQLDKWTPMMPMDGVGAAMEQ